MQSFNWKTFVLVLTLILSLVAVAAGQGGKEGGKDWETLRPEKEQFSILIPKGSVYEEASKVPYHKMELNTRFYISKTEGGPIFAVVSLSGIKSNPAAYTEIQRVNSYVDAFKIFFIPKVRDKAGIAQLTFIRERALQGNPGREYRLTLGTLNGIVHAYATSRRFYAIVYLNSKKDDALQEQFLSSFVLPDKIGTSAQAAVDTEAPVVAQPPPSAPEAEAKPGKPMIDSAEVRLEEPEHGRTPVSADGARAPISGGVLNGKAISLPAPEYPASARQAKIAGAVGVKVTVDESGGVISAQAVSGHLALQAAAVAAARLARFSPTLLMGEPVKVTGVIVYNFGDPLN